MTSLRSLATALLIGVVSTPALAGGMSFDLPRLTFPDTAPDATRDCHGVPGPAACAPTAE